MDLARPHRSPHQRWLYTFVRSFLYCLLFILTPWNSSASVRAVACSNALWSSRIFIHTPSNHARMPTLQLIRLLPALRPYPRPVCLVHPVVRSHDREASAQANETLRSICKPGGPSQHHNACQTIRRQRKGGEGWQTDVPGGSPTPWVSPYISYLPITHTKPTRPPEIVCDLAYIPGWRGEAAWQQLE